MARRAQAEQTKGVISAIEHRGILGALVVMDDGRWYAQIRRHGVNIQSDPAPFDLFSKDSVLQKNWNAAVDVYLEKHG